MQPANQLSIYGTVANWCDALTQLIPFQLYPSMEKSVAKVNDQLSQKVGTSGSGHVGTDTWDQMFKQRGTACVCIMKDLKTCQMR